MKNDSLRAICGAGIIALGLCASAPQALAQTAVTPLYLAAYTSASGGSESYLRFHNAGTATGTVQISLTNAATGDILGVTTRDIAAGTSPQFSMTELEASVGDFTKPPVYLVKLETAMQGTVSHFYFNAANGTMTNFSSCSSGMSASASRVHNVNNSLFNTLWPSSLEVVNTGSAAAAIKLGVYDASTGTKIGTYTGVSLASRAGASIPISAIESQLLVTAVAAKPHYTIEAEAPFTGFIQHVITNNNTTMTSDFSAACTLPASQATPGTPPASIQTIAYMKSNPADDTEGVESYFRFHNSGTTVGTVTLTLANLTTGASLATWTSAPIPVNASMQVGIRDIESQATSVNPPLFAKQSKYLVIISANSGITAGAVNHVVFNWANKSLSNFSTCTAGVGAQAAGQLANVHSTAYDLWPAYVGITNTASTSTTLGLDIHNARTGDKLGTYTTVLAPGTNAMIAVSDIEAGAGITPDGPTGDTDVARYNIKAQAGFNGSLQYMIYNKNAGVVTDLTAACTLK